MSYFSHWQKAVPLPIDFITKYMASANATYVKVYLYGLAMCYEDASDVTNASIAEALDILETDVSKAWRYWKKVGLIRSEGKSGIIFEPVGDSAHDSIPEPVIKKNAEKQNDQDAVKEPSMKEISDALKVDPKMKDTISMAEQILKKPLSRREITSLYNYMDWYQMSGELVLALLEYCVSIDKTSPSYIDKVALSWHEQGVGDLLTAGKIITHAEKEQRIIRRCKKIFGIDRAFSSTENKYILSWINDFSSGENLIKAAYERTVNNTGKLSFPYMNTILRSWHEKGIKTVSQIEEKEGKKPAAQKSSYELDDMAAIERRLRLAKKKN